MSIKKPYVELVAFLENNSDAKVGSIIEEIKSMVEAKVKTSTLHYDEDGNLIAIYCYYHKQWELIFDVEYGAKANTKTGYNNMCKIGCNQWYKQQRDAKKSKEKLLADLMEGIVTTDDAKSTQEDIEHVRTSLVTDEMPQGFSSIEELEDFLNS